jgi:hypothetical protein
MSQIVLLQPNPGYFTVLIFLGLNNAAMSKNSQLDSGKSNPTAV